MPEQNMNRLQLLWGLRNFALLTWPAELAMMWLFYFVARWLAGFLVSSPNERIVVAVLGAYVVFTNIREGMRVFKPHLDDDPGHPGEL
jgi:hypothetical protein